MWAGRALGFARARPCPASYPQATLCHRYISLPLLPPPLAFPLLPFAFLLPRPSSASLPTFAFCPLPFAFLLPRPSSACLPTFAFCPLTFAFCLPPPSPLFGFPSHFCLLPFAFCLSPFAFLLPRPSPLPRSGVRSPAFRRTIPSSIQHPASSIRYPASPCIPRRPILQCRSEVAYGERALRLRRDEYPNWGQVLNFYFLASVWPWAIVGSGGHRGHRAQVLTFDTCPVWKAAFGVRCEGGG